jgi:hypothetical protein
MGAANSEVSYTSASTRRWDHEVYMDMWWHWKIKVYSPLVMTQELITIIVIIIVYSIVCAMAQCKWYKLTHQEMPSYNLNYNTEYRSEVLHGLSPAKQKQAMTIF